jgi:DNA-binding transcriptional ArsR family regulator
LKALAEPRRVAILKLLAGGEMRAGEIADEFETTRPAISEHLRVLVEARLLVLRREGTRRIYALRKEAFVELHEFLDQLWDSRLARLKSAAERETRSRSRGKR